MAFSTSPNRTAADGGGSFSPFTGSFLKHATTPGWLVQRVVAEVTKEVGEASNWAQNTLVAFVADAGDFLQRRRRPGPGDARPIWKAAQSRDLLAKCERQDAIATALQGLPEKFNDSDIGKYRAAHEVRSLGRPVAEYQAPRQGSRPHKFQPRWNARGHSLAASGQGGA